MEANGKNIKKEGFFRAYIKSIKALLFVLCFLANITKNN